MSKQDELKAQWRRILARTGAAGRDWRKSIVTQLAAKIGDAEALAADPAQLKAAIRTARRLRAHDHWSFKPERLRRMLALYLRARAVRRTAR